MNSRIKKITKVIFVVLVSCLFAEVILRLALPFELAFDTWFPRGIHAPDPKFGMVHAPNFVGFTRHRDHANKVLFSQNEHGFRVSSSPGSLADERKSIVIIGAQSAGFGYGLRNEMIIGGQIAKHSSHPVTVYTTAWPGFSLRRNFLMYASTMGKDAKPDLAIILLLREGPNTFLQYPEDPLAPMKPENSETLFQNFDDLVRPPRFPAAQYLGRYFYNSYVIGRSAKIIDRTIVYYKRFIKKSGFAIKKIKNVWATLGFDDADELVAQHRTPPKLTKADINNKEKEGLAKFAEVMSAYKKYFEQRGAQMLVVFISNGYFKQRKSDKGMMYAAPQGMALPPEINRLNLLDYHNFLPSPQKGEDMDANYIYAAPKGYFIADGHYGPRITSEMGRMIAIETDKLLRQEEKRKQLRE